MIHDNGLQISAKLTKTIGQLTLSGELMARSRMELERVLRDWLEVDVMRIAVHCGGLQQIDSAGMSALLAAIPKVRKRGGDVVLSEVNPNLKALFQVVSMKRYFKIFATQAEALDYLKKLKIAPTEETVAR